MFDIAEFDCILNVALLTLRAQNFTGGMKGAKNLNHTKETILGAQNFNSLLHLNRILTINLNFGSFYHVKSSELVFRLLSSQMTSF